MEVLIGIMIGFLIGYYLIKSPRGSRKYRKTLADLFVAGRIRQISKDKDVDLSQELIDYKSFYKKGRISSLDLDESIEEELQFDLEKDINKEQKKSK